MDRGKSKGISDLIDSWNQHLPNVPLSEADIKNPNEYKFRQLLISLLNSLNVDTTCYENMDNETGSRLRASRCRLVAAVNHFLKIAFPQSANFSYMDLISPSKSKYSNLSSQFNTIFYF